MSAEIFLGLALMGIVKAIDKAAQDQNGESTIPGWLKITICAVLGVLAGTLGMYYGYARFAGIDPLTGLMIGLAASGGIALFQATGEAVGRGMVAAQARLARGTATIPVRGTIGAQTPNPEGDPIKAFANPQDLRGFEHEGMWPAYDPEAHGKG